MNKYESIFIIKGRINEKKAGEEFEKIVKDFSLCVSIVDTDFRGKKKLAYPINKNTQGYFCVINFETKNNAGEIAELETELKYNENVLKFIIVREV